MNRVLDHPAVRDAVLLILRLVMGVVFIAHGWQNTFVQGVSGKSGLAADYVAASVPKPEVSAWVVSITDMLGGALIVVGLLAPLVAGVFVILSAAAIYFFSAANGFFIADGGFEYHAVLIAGLLILVVFGSGRASLDNAFSRFA